MYLYVTLMRVHGKALDQHQIRSAEAAQVNVIVSHENVTVLALSRKSRKRLFRVQHLTAGDRADIDAPKACPC